MKLKYPVFIQYDESKDVSAILVPDLEINLFDPEMKAKIKENWQAFIKENLTERINKLQQIPIPSKVKDYELHREYQPKSERDFWFKAHIELDKESEKHLFEKVVPKAGTLLNLVGSLSGGFLSIMATIVTVGKGNNEGSYLGILPAIARVAFGIITYSYSTSSDKLAKFGRIIDNWKPIKFLRSSPPFKQLGELASLLLKGIRYIGSFWEKSNCSSNLTSCLNKKLSNSSTAKILLKFVPGAALTVMIVGDTVAEGMTAFQGSSGIVEKFNGLKDNILTPNEIYAFALLVAITGTLSNSIFISSFLLELMKSINDKVNELFTPDERIKIVSEAEAIIEDLSKENTPLIKESNSNSKDDEELIRSYSPTN